MSFSIGHITKHLWVVACATLAMAACSNYGNPGEPGNALINDLSWQEIESTARGSKVYMRMWQGDPQINAYMANYVIPKIDSLYGIELHISAGQGEQLTSLFLMEKESGVATNSTDLVWINGETFYQLRELDALYGPFTDLLPNNRLIRWDDPFINRDFQQAVDGLECPWGNVQMALIYDSLRTPQPPTSFKELEQYIRKHPGTFAIPTEFTGMTLLKSWMLALTKPNELYGDFDPERYAFYRDKLFTKLDSLRPYLWRDGKQFPENLASMHQLFAAGELHFTLSNNDAEVENKIAQGILPPTSYALVPKPGTIRNSHYLGIAKGSGNIYGALMVVNFLISPEAQLHKMKPEIWGDFTVLRPELLEQDHQQQFYALQKRLNGPARSELDSLAHQELNPQYMINLYRDFKKLMVHAD